MCRLACRFIQETDGYKVDAMPLICQGLTLSPTASCYCNARTPAERGRSSSLLTPKIDTDRPTDNRQSQTYSRQCQTCGLSRWGDSVLGQVTAAAGSDRRLVEPDRTPAIDGRYAAQIESLQAAQTDTDTRQPCTKYRIEHSQSRWKSRESPSPCPDGSPVIPQARVPMKVP